MLQLSPEDHEIIARFPLGNYLDSCQAELRELESSVPLEVPSEAGAPGLQQQVISRLVWQLTGHHAAFHLKAKKVAGSLALQLSLIFGRIQTHPFSYERFRALSLLVINQESDVEIWKAVFSLVDGLSTPPPRATTSYSGTPVVRSSAALQGSDQTRKKLDPVLFYEITHCTHRGVGGFFQKYFEDKSWEGESKRISRLVKTQKWYDSDRWSAILDQPTEDDFWNWLSRFQTEFLSSSSNSFHTTSHARDLQGVEAKRQLDVFVKKRLRGVQENVKHDWKDVRIIGELKQSGTPFKPLILQLTRYARDVFTAQPTRRFLHAFTICGRVMELWVFDRSGPYSSGGFDIHKEPEKFIKTLTGYLSMGNEELGLDMYIEQNGLDCSISITPQGSEEASRIQLVDRPFVKQRAIVCRGTTCFRTTDGANVAKFSWISAQRQHESELLRVAREKQVEGVAQLVGYKQLTTIDELRSGLTFTSPYRFRATSSSNSNSLSLSRSSRMSSNSKRKHDGHDGQVAGSRKRSSLNSQASKVRQQSQTGQSASLDISLYDTDSGKYSNRIFGCLVVSPAGRSLSEFRSQRELLAALRDAIKGHRSLYLVGKILHRDISENNIIITDPRVADGYTGMLIDLDLAKTIGSGSSGARHQTGTVEFMAIQVLQAASHTYRHDLESFFYVLLWVCARRAWEIEHQCSKSDRPRASRLNKWYTGSFRDISETKQGHMYADGLRNVLREFPPSLDPVKPLCEKIRAILFPLRNGELDIGTHTPAEELYTKIIGAYDDALAELDS